MFKNRMESGHEILILTTGGTIDKHYFDDLSEYQIADTVVNKIFDISRVRIPFSFKEVCRKDSLDLDDTDRENLARVIRESKSDRVIVTHGTDTMTNSATALREIPKKTIVFVGALSPARFAESDAPFNLGMAFATAQIAPPGVYITMNGTVFLADEVSKDRSKGAFIKTVPDPKNSFFESRREGGVSI